MDIRQETKGDQKYFYQFDGCAIIAIDGYDKKKKRVDCQQAS